MEIGDENEEYKSSEILSQIKHLTHLRLIIKSQKYPKILS